MVIGWLVMFDSEFNILKKHVIASIYFYENITLMNEVGYFDISSSVKPLLHLWSLGVEGQFYVFWPIVVYFSFRRSYGVLASIAIIGCLSFIASCVYLADDPQVAYFASLGRFWELMIGAGLAYLNVRQVKIFAATPNFCAGFGGALLLVSFVVINPGRDFPGFWALLPTGGTALIIASGANAWIGRKVLSNRYMVWGGLISYPLYLWHWILLSYAMIILGPGTSVKHNVLRLGLVVMAVVFAWATLRFVESPLRGSRGRWWKLLCLVFTAAVLVITATQAIAPRLTGLGLTGLGLPGYNEWDFLDEASEHADGGAGGLIYWFHPEREKLVLFMSDSQVAQYAPRVAKLTDEAGRPGAVFAVHSYCIPIQTLFTVHPDRDKGCKSMQERAFELARDDRVRSVVIGGAWQGYFIGNPFHLLIGNGIGLETPQGKALAFAQLERQIRDLSALGKRVFLLIGNPHSASLNSFDLRVRLGTAKTLEPDRFAPVPAEQFRLRDEITALARRAGATVIDPFAALCSDGVLCRATSDQGVPLFRDGWHFNRDWVRDGATFIDEAIEE